MAAITSNEVDAETSDNNFSGFVSVRDPNDDDDGGSGSIGMPFLLLMGLFGMLVRRRFPASA